MKEYVLWGGGVLVFLVVAHGLWQAWRASRANPPPISDRGGDDDAGGQGREDTESESAPTGPGTIGGVAAVADSPVGERDARTLQPRNLSVTADEGPAAGRAEPSRAAPVGSRAGTDDESQDIPERVPTDGSLDVPEMAPHESRLAPSPDNDGTERAEPFRTDADAQVPLAASERGPRRGRRVEIPGKRTEPRVTPAKERPQIEVPRNADVEAGTGTETKNNAVPDILVIWVVAATGESFNGKGLVAVLASNGLRYGHDGLFHKHDVNSGEELFKVVNGFEPGTFDLSDLEALKTSRLVLIQSLRNGNAGVAAFNEMLNAAQDISHSLDGSMCDEAMAPFTGQTIDDYRRRVTDHKRKQARK